jgi:hypothetical protein
MVDKTKEIPILDEYRHNDLPSATTTGLVQSKAIL